MSLNRPDTRVPRPPRTIPLALAGILLLAVGGGAVAATAIYLELQPPGPAPPGSLTLIDDLGRSVAVPTSPSRVVVLAPSIMDSMARLGLRASVTGVDCSSPAFGGLSADYDSAQVAAWNLSSSMCVQTYPLDVEELLNLSPQLVLASTIVPVSDLESLSSTYTIPVVFLQPATIGGIASDVRLIAQIFSGPAKATALEESIDRELGNVSALDSNLTSAGIAFPTVLLTYDVNPRGSTQPGYWTFGPGTFGQSLIELAGGTSISANATLPYPELSGGQVLLADPEVVVYGTGFGVDLSSFSSGPDWGNLTAVQQGHDFAVDSTLITEPGPSMVLTGLPELVALLHPSGPGG